MLCYGESAQLEVNRWQWNLDRLSAEQKLLIPSMQGKIDNARAAVTVNGDFLTSIIIAGEACKDVGLPLSAAKAFSTRHVPVTATDVSKVRSCQSLCFTHRVPARRVAPVAALVRRSSECRELSCL